MKHIYNVIAKLEMDNKEYQMLKIDNAKIAFVINRNGSYSFDLSEEELKICAKIYNSLKINFKTSITTRKINLLGKNIEIHYDYGSKLYYWYEIVNGEKKEATEEINVILNNRYNHISEIMAEITRKSDSNGNKKFIKRFIEIGKKMLPLIVSAGISLSTLAGCALGQEIEEDSFEVFPKKSSVQVIESEPEPSNELLIIDSYFAEKCKCEEEIERRAKQKYDYNDIKNAIESNPYLQEREKEILLSLKFVFDENHEYMDLEKIIERLSNLKIYYENDSDFEEIIHEYIEDSFGLQGVYISDKNEIHCREKEKNNAYIVIHEILHVFQVGGDYRLSFELSNEILTRETIERIKNLLEKWEFKKYYYNSELGYSHAIYAGYGLLELLKKEERQRYQFFPRDYILEKSLREIDGKKYTVEEYEEQTKRIYKLLDNINEINKSELSGSNREPYLNLINGLDYYYQKLDGNSIYERFTPGLYICTLCNYIGEEWDEWEDAYNMTVKELGINEDVATFRYREFTRGLRTQNFYFDDGYIYIDLSEKRSWGFNVEDIVFDKTFEKAFNRNLSKTRDKSDENEL